MAALIKEEQTAQFQFLANTSDEYLIELCKLAFEYLKDGPNPQKYLSAAQRLERSPDYIQQVVEIVLFFVVECLRFRVSRNDIDTLGTVGFKEEQIEILWQFITKQQDSIRKLLGGSEQTRLHFRDLDWRIETRIASRALLEQVTPQISIKLHLDHEVINENKEKLSNNSASSQRQVVMQIDPGNLRQIIQSLDAALLESKSHRTRLFCRTFQKK